MLPHERSLVKTFEGRPFALLGVNADPTLEDLQLMTQKGHTTWRNFWDGQPGSGGGQIQEIYQIEAYPTFVLIDPQGVVREAFIGAPPPKALEKRIEEMVRQAEAANATS